MMTRGAYRLLIDAVDRALVISMDDPKIPLETAGKLTEEVGELMREVLILGNTPGTTYRTTSKAKLTEELADVFLCAVSLIQKLDIRVDDLAVMMREKAAKWEKNLNHRPDHGDTHYE